MKKIIPATVVGQFRVLSQQQFEAYTFHVGKRLRSLDTKTVRAIADSIKVEGMLVPIIVSGGTSDDLMNFSLIAGHHRLEAMKLVWAETADPCERSGHVLPMRVVPINETGPHRELVEISENLHRKEFSKEERQAAAAAWDKAGFLSNGQKPAAPQGGRPAGLFETWRAQTGFSYGTARRRWGDFCVETGCAATTDKATAEEFQQFLDWLAADAAARAARPPAPPRKPKAPTPEQAARDAEILRLKDEGKNQMEIAKELGIKSTSTVNNTLKKAGLTTQRASAPAPTPVPTQSGGYGMWLARTKENITKYRAAGLNVVSDLQEVLS